MRKIQAPGKRQLALSPLSQSIAAVLGALAIAAPAHAFEIDTGIPDFSLRWDNTFRYNVGIRTESIDPNITAWGGGRSLGSDSKFDQGDLITNRLDVLSELEGNFENKKYGFRVSAAAWYDQAYNDHSVAGTAYVNGTYSDYSKRWYNGPSGEFLDAFVYANVEAGGRPLSLKLGQHSLFWGNALFSGGGVAYSQQPVDQRKGAATPGTEVRELFLPLNQISGTYQITQEVQLAGQYYFDWKPLRFPDGGTYWGTADVFGLGPNNPASSMSVKDPSDKSGDYGLAVRITPATWNGTTVGLYYREFTEKGGFWLMGGGRSLVFAENTKVIGASLDATLGSTAVGAELVLRKNAALNGGNLTAALGATTEAQGPRGDVWHASVNGLQSMPNSGLYDSGIMMAELTYDRLDKVTKNGNMFNYIDGSYGRTLFVPGVNCVYGTQSGCATKSAWGLAVQVRPTWSQLFPGIDLSTPITLRYALKGNTPDFGGTSERTGVYSIAAEFDINKKWLVTATYSDLIAPIKGSGVAATGNGQSWMLSDRGYLALTVKTSF